MDIYLIRHTTPAIEPGICYGCSDIDLADSFHTELQEIRSKLPVNSQGCVVYSSPLRRCLRLAEELTLSKIHTDERLQELDFGQWEMKGWDHINQEKLDKWMHDFVNVRCPGGESYAQLQERVLDCWKQVLVSHHKQVLIVTHAGVIRCLLAHLLDMPLSSSFRLKIDLGSICSVSIEENRTLVNSINR